MLNQKSQFSDPELFKPAKNVDYFDNVCDYEPGSLTQVMESAANFDVRTSDEKNVLSLEKFPKNSTDTLELFKETSSEKNLPRVFKEPNQPEKVKGCK